VIQHLFRVPGTRTRGLSKKCRLLGKKYNFRKIQQMTMKPLTALTYSAIFGLILFYAVTGCSTSNTKSVATNTDSIPIENAVKLFFTDERKKMDDIETLEADTITVLKYTKLNDTTAAATLKISGLLKPAPRPVPQQTVRYSNTMDWKFYKRDNSWAGVPTSGWIR
jgi:hypothetical protein